MISAFRYHIAYYRATMQAIKVSQTGTINVTEPSESGKNASHLTLPVTIIIYYYTGPYNIVPCNT